MADKKKRRKKNPWWYKLGILVFGTMFCVSAFMVGRDLLEAKKEADAFDSLNKLAAEYMTAEVPTESVGSAGNANEPEEPNDANEPNGQERLLREAAGYAALKKENPDYVGWLRLPDTKIDYPVVNRESDPEYYLRRAFDGSRSRGGTLFLGEASSADTKSVIIYGHNMRNGSMFGTLDSYKKYDYWKEHPLIRFYVDGEPRSYEIFAAVETRVLYEDEDGFRYYRYDGDISEEEYNDLVTWLRGHSDYDTGTVPEYRDQILMLSTCSYHTQNGRFVVAARRVEEP